MISRAQDYSLVTPVGVIDGGIIPARDVAADGSEHAVRAEDLCFALEAVKERNFRQISGSGGYWFPSPTHVVRRADWGNVWGLLRAMCFEAQVRAIDANETFAATQYMQARAFEIEEFYPSAVLSSCYTSDVKSRVRDNAFWRRFYFDLKRTDRLCVKGGSLDNLGSWSATGTYTDLVGNTYQVKSGDTGNIWSSSGDARIRAIGYTDRSGSERRVVYGTSNCTMTRTNLPSIGRVASAVAVVAYELRVNGVGEDEAAWYYFARSYPCTISNAGVVVDPSMFLTSGFDIVSECESLGHSFPEDKPSYARGGEAKVEIIATYLVADYNFRTEIRSLNWNWTP